MGILAQEINNITQTAIHKPIERDAIQDNTRELMETDVILNLVRMC